MRMLSKSAWLAAAIALCLQPARTQAPEKASIAGDVVDGSTGRGISGARVRIQCGQDDPLFATADEQGGFRLTGLNFRSCQASARYPGFMGAQEAALQLSPSSPDGQVRLELRHYAVIEGKVTDTVGVPVAGVAVEALQRYPIGEPHNGYIYNDGNYQYVGSQRAVTDDLGEYRIAPLAAGSYYIFVRTGSYYASGPQSQPFDARARNTFYPHSLKPSDTKPVELAEGKQLRADVQIARQGGAKLSGRILGLAGAQPGSFAWVRIIPLSPGGSGGFAKVTGDDFTAADILPGKYILEAGQFAADDMFSQNPLAAARRTVEVGAEDAAGIDLALAPTPDVSGTVIFESGCAAVPVWIQLQQDSYTPRSLHVDTDGRFVAQHLFPGQYKAYVQPETLANTFAASVKLGDTEVLKDGFEVTAETTGPLRIAMSCATR